MSEQRPRLLVLASTYPRWRGDHEPGFVHELSKRLTSYFQITVLCPHAEGASIREQIDGVEVVRYRYAPQRLERLVNDGGIVTNLRLHRWMFLLLPGFFLSQLVWLIRLQLRLSPAAIHAHWIIPQAFIAVLTNLMTGRRTPILVTSHGADLFALNGSLMRRLKRWTLRWCAQATVVSQAMLAPISSLGMPDTHVTVAPMGVDMSRFTPVPADIRSTDELLFVGRLVEKKGLRYLIDALPAVLEKHPGVRLTVAGFGPELEQRQAQVARLGLQDKVHFLGAVEQTSLPALYQRATMLVAPFVEAASGDREGLGLVSVEALACGCPVVTTRIEAVKEVFGGQWPPYLAESGDATSLANQIINVLDTPNDATTWVATSHAALIHRFSWQSVAAGYAVMLNALVTQLPLHQGNEP